MTEEHSGSEDRAEAQAFENFRASLAAEPGLANLVVLETIDSTQRLARRIVDEYRRDGGSVPTVQVLALEQTVGRGRRGNAWQSPSGAGVYASMLVSLKRQEELERLPLAVAIGLCRGVDELIGERRCSLKWPNDLLVNGRKLGGILIEQIAPGAAGAGDPSGSLDAIIGFGVNFRAAAEHGALVATSLCDENPAMTSLGAAAAELLRGVQRVLEGLGRPAEILKAYGRRSLHRPGDMLNWRVGGESGSGEFLGFDERGFLRLRDAETGEERLLFAGEVRGR
ncbi:MAG: biotin--[acetyl-CoA-carboxylase] ligase [Acidobacteriota bacterium]